MKLDVWIEEEKGGRGDDKGMINYSLHATGRGSVAAFLRYFKHLRTPIMRLITQKYNHYLSPCMHPHQSNKFYAYLRVTHVAVPVEVHPPFSASQSV